jgi:hypothetical protein
MQRSARVLCSAAILVSLASCTGCTLRLSFDDPKAQANASTGNAQTIARLRGLLQSNDPQVRSIAAAELGGMGPAARDAEPDLDRLLADPDHHVRFAAARALGQIDPGDRATVPTLVMVIDDPQTAPEDRRAAVTLLGDMGAAAASARPAIVRLQHSDDADVRDAAIAALNKIDAATPAAPAPGVGPAAPPTTRPYVAPNTSSSIDRPGSAATPRSQAASFTAGPAPSEETLPKPDLRTDGIQHYSPGQLEALRTWIHRQNDLTPDQQRENLQRFEEWNRQQEAKIAARSEAAATRPSSRAQ